MSLVAAAHSLTFEALGGTVELFAFDPAEPLEATAEWIRELHRRLTRFEPDSELSRFNASAGRWVEISGTLEALLRAALYSFEESGGLVNAAVLPALLAAGYDDTFERVAARRGALTAPAALGPIPPLPVLLTVDPGRARLERGSAVDLGGIAKGWIADRAVERLGGNSLVSCGGDLHARGGGETGEGWPVGFGDRTLLLRDLAAATSGTTRRRWGDGRHHLIDPRTGAPATSDLREVSVLAPTALDAEIHAKTALLLGSKRAEDHLRPRSSGWALS